MPRAPRAAQPHATDVATPYVKGKGNEKGKGKHKGINLTVHDDDFSTPNIRSGSKRKRSLDDVLPANTSSSSKRKRSASPVSDTTVPESSDADDEETGTLNYRNKRYPHKDTAPMTPVKLKEWWAYKRPPTPRPPRREPSPIPDEETAESMESPIEDFSDEEMDESLCLPESQPPGWLDWQEVSPIRPWKPEPERRPWKPEIVHRRCSPGPRLQCAAIFASQPRDSYTQPSDDTEPEPTQRSEHTEDQSLFLMSQPERPAEELTLQPMSQPSELAEELGLRELMSQPTGLPEMLSLDTMSQLSEDSEEPMSQRSELADSEETVMPMFQRSELTDPEETEVPLSQRTELADPEEQEESLSQCSEPDWEQTKLSRDLFAYAIRHKLDTEKKPCHPDHVKDPVKRAKILAWHDQYHYKYRHECDIGKVKMDFEYQFHPDDMTVSLASRSLLAEAIEQDRGIRFGYTNEGEE